MLLFCLDDSVLDNSLPTPMDVDTPTKLSFSQASGQFIGLSQCDVSRLDSTIGKIFLD